MKSLRQLLIKRSNGENYNMCLINFERFERIKKENAVTGYRNWYLNIKSPEFLKSLNVDFYWTNKIGSHKVLNENSGLYSYNNNNNYYNYYYNNNNNNYNNSNYNSNYYYDSYNNHYHENYFVSGIIKQYGKTAIHAIGYRSQYAYIDTLFTIRKSDAKGDQEFLDWIDSFNKLIEEKAKYYKAKTISWQDFLDQNK